MVKMIGVGDNTVDCYLHIGKMYPGGNAVNVAVFAKRLGHQSAYLGWLARDTLGMLIYQSLLDEGVNVTGCRLVEGENAFCEISIKDGDHVFGNFNQGVCDQISLNSSDLKFISGFDLTHTSIYSHVDPFLEQLKEASNLLSYDFSEEWDKDILAGILPYVNIAFLSDHTADLNRNKDLLQWALSLGPDMIIVTSGDKGAMLYDGKRFYYQPIMRVEKLIDTLGAGDAFASCFLVNYCCHGSIERGLQNAANYAADVCTYHGAFGHGMPLYKKIKQD